ncbi:MAG: hypothetical protein V1734_00100 [Nanoarchaeota archaeon]
MAKLQQIKDSFFISIPKEKIIRGKLKKGDAFDWEYNERGHLELIPLK